MPDDILHIYGQVEPHDTVVIVGTRESLLKLAATITLAARDESCDGAQSPIFYDTSGEGYCISVTPTTETDMQNNWRTPSAIAMDCG